MKHLLSFPRTALGRIAYLGSALALSLAAPVTAADSERPLTRQCEVALARSALPSVLRESASVYVLGAKGFAQLEKRTGDYTCIVARNHQDSLIPQCFDPPGTRAILPKLLDEGALLRAGKSFLAIMETIDKRLADGHYQPVDQPGLVYMMSPYNFIYARNAQRVVHVHPHVMFHAPHIKAKALGSSVMDGMRNHGLPFVIDEGVHGYMITMVDEAADSAEVDRLCAGQLPPTPPALGE